MPLVPIVSLHEPIRLTDTERAYALAYLTRTGNEDLARALGLDGEPA